MVLARANLSQQGASNVPLDAAPKRLLGVAVVVIGPDSVGGDINCPGHAKDVRELPLQVRLVVVPVVTN